MSDVKLVKTLEAKKRGRPATVVFEDQAAILSNLLKGKQKTKKELITESGLIAAVVDKFLKTESTVSKVGSKKGMKYTIL